MQVGGVLGGAGNVRRGGVEPQPASWQHQESRCWGGSTRTRATRSVRGARERVSAATQGKVAAAGAISGPETARGQGPRAELRHEESCLVKAVGCLKGWRPRKVPAPSEMRAESTGDR